MAKGLVHKIGATGRRDLCYLALASTLVDLIGPSANDDWPGEHNKFC